MLIVTKFTPLCCYSKGAKNYMSKHWIFLKIFKGSFQNSCMTFYLVNASALIPWVRIFLCLHKLGPVKLKNGCFQSKNIKMGDGIAG